MGYETEANNFALEAQQERIVQIFPLRAHEVHTEKFIAIKVHREILIYFGGFKEFFLPLRTIKESGSKPSALSFSPFVEGSTHKS